MSAEYVAFAILGGLLLASNIFWAKLVFNMCDRLMSRDFYDYVQTSKLKKTARPMQAEEQEHDIVDPIDEQQAATLNSIIGIA